MAKVRTTDFALAVEAAARAVASSSMTGPGGKPNAKKVRQARHAVQLEPQRLLQIQLAGAVARVDIARCKELVASGARPGGIFEGHQGLFDHWLQAARLNIEKGVGDLRGQEELGAMLLWLDQSGVPLLAGQYGANGHENAAQRAKDHMTPGKHMAWRSGEVTFIMQQQLGPVGNVASRCFARLAQSWSEPRGSSGSFDTRQWQDHAYLSKNSSGWRGSESVAIELALSGEPMGPEHWFVLAKRLVQDPEMVDAGVMSRLLELHNPSSLLHQETLELLMVHALWHDDLGEMALVAARAREPIWRLPWSVWQKMELVVDQSVGGPSILEFAAWQACQVREAGKTPTVADNVEKMKCLRAIASLPGAPELAGPLRAWIVFEASLPELALIEKYAPCLMVPDQQGETVAHVWARDFLGGKHVAKIPALLKSPRGKLAATPNVRGQTAYDLAKANREVSAGVMQRLDKAWAYYEAGQIKTETGKSMTGTKPKRSRL